MLIEAANRFGLAQLHQLRGRVGRGIENSYCLLIPDTEDAIENERLSVMVETNDGFILAEKDLEQRGPGEFLGTRQSGYTPLRMANLTDIHLIEKARKEAVSLIEHDPTLSDPSLKPLLQKVNSFWSPGKGDIS
jgi:ATP-dependent DNA helicase RecG